ncbi:MAG: nuclear transport factor 2 family protein [Cyclobacteriaceae bacterium]|nr:nuclear transport factor 2 family protein [Cyclobacteriaceae bacterium]
MKKLTVWMITLLSVEVSGTWAQSPDEVQIRQVIENLFTGMKKGDSTLVRSVFHETATMATALRNREQKAVLRRESSVDGFVKAVGTPRADALNEEIWGLEIKTDGDLAQAWCDFAFYVGKNFSHCGVNTFQLFRTEKGWKIFHIADTRRPTDCKIPDEISTKYK